MSSISYYIEVLIDAKIEAALNSESTDIAPQVAVNRASADLDRALTDYLFEELEK